jgi:hypothetical protein
MQIRRLLRQTASQADAPDNRRGWGIVNADAAIRAAERMARAHPPSALQIDDLHPNPASTQITLPVRVPATTARVHLSIQSPLGPTVATETHSVEPGPNWLSMNVADLPPGLYWYRVRGSDRVHTGTVSIVRE